MPEFLSGLMELFHREDRKRELLQEYQKRRSHRGYIQSAKRKQHGNFHFHDDGLITFTGQGNLLLALYGLEDVYYLLAIQSVNEGECEDYYWQEFNYGIQKMINTKLSELEPFVEELGLE